MRLALPALLMLMMAGCGGGDGSAPAPPSAPTPPAPVVVRDSVIGGGASAAPVNVNGIPLATVEPSVLTLLLEAGQNGATTITGKPLCAISIHRVKYNAIGAAGEATDASAAIMVPSGSDPACTGPRPLLLYAHGTSLDKNYDMANLNSTEPRLVAAMFAARGFLVVAPNYAGYAGSSLDYHPYLDANQQAGDMIDALRAARSVFASIKASESGKLFLSGYSQGGFVALATQRAMEEQGGFALAGVGAMSGPYALLPFGDTLFGGAPSKGSIGFLPLAITAAQRAGGNVYSAPADIYEAAFAGVADKAAATLFAAASLPQTPGFAAYFGDNNLIRSSYRAAYLDDVRAQPCGLSPSAPLACSPANALRRVFQKNDLRTFAPVAPLLLCGGKDDPTVPFMNTLAADAYFRTRSTGTVSVVDIDDTPGSSDPWRVAKLNFLTAKTALRLDAIQRGQSPQAAVEDNYHAGLVPPFCFSVVRDTFTAALTK